MNYYKDSLLKTQIWEILNRLEFEIIFKIIFERFMVNRSSALFTIWFVVDHMRKF